VRACIWRMRSGHAKQLHPHPHPQPHQHPHPRAQVIQLCMRGAAVDPTQATRWRDGYADGEWSGGKSGILSTLSPPLAFVCVCLVPKVSQARAEQRMGKANSGRAKGCVSLENKLRVQNLRVHCEDCAFIVRQLVIERVRNAAN